MDSTEEIDQELPPHHQSGFVAVVGAPNVGKSTLMNRLLGQKIAIVSPRPQTTRTRQLGILTTDDYQIIFVDTPGLIKKAMHTLDEVMVETAVEAIDGADLVLWLVDISQAPAAADSEVARLLRGLDDGVPLILALNKVDLLAPDQVLERTEAYRAMLPDAGWIVFSADADAGVDELQQMIIERLPQGPRFYPREQITDSWVRDIAGEMVREQLLLQLRDEVPHSLAVVVDEFKERDNGVTYVRATIFVERDSHKRIVIGRKGQQIGAVGSAARRQIEQLLDGKVFLDLHVKVVAKWRRDRQQLERFGLVR